MECWITKRTLRCCCFESTLLNSNCWCICCFLAPLPHFFPGRLAWIACQARTIFFGGNSTREKATHNFFGSLSFFSIFWVCWHFCVRCKTYENIFHSFHIYLNTLWKVHDFSVTLILREINIRHPGSSKNAIFCHIGDSEFWFFGQFQPSKSAKIHGNQNSETINVVKWQILHF